jgi:hypothetical protein
MTLREVLHAENSRVQSGAPDPTGGFTNLRHPVVIKIDILHGNYVTQAQFAS